MNITLSADKTLIEKCRRYAKEHQTSLNNLVRDYLKKISGEMNLSKSAREFADLANTKSGCSSESYVFDRDSIYDRG